MGHSQAEKAQSRERILDAAAQQIREGGLEGVSIAALMKSANLTHGGFYGHFPSRDALIAAALDRAMDQGEASFAAVNQAAPPAGVKSIVNSYLSPKHRDDLSGGCAFAALACDVGRADDEAVRTAMAGRLERSFQQMAQAMGGGPDAEDAAVSAWCTMVGAIALSRVFRGTKRADDILRQARQAVLELAARTEGEEAAS